MKIDEIVQQAVHQSGRIKDAPCPATPFLATETVSRGMRNQRFQHLKGMR